MDEPREELRQGGGRGSTQRENQVEDMFFYVDLAGVQVARFSLMYSNAY